MEQIDWYTLQQEARARAGLPPGRDASSWYGVTPSSPEQRRAYLEQVLLGFHFSMPAFDQSIAKRDEVTEAKEDYLMECDSSCRTESDNHLEDDAECGETRVRSRCSDRDPGEGSKKVDDDTKACAICLEEYLQGDAVCRSYNRRCKHLFHRKCVIDWLMSDDTCPCCRQKYLEYSGTTERLNTVSSSSDYQEQVTRQDNETVADANVVASVGQVGTAVSATPTTDVPAGRSNAAARLPSPVVASLRRKIGLPASLFRRSPRRASVGAVELAEGDPISGSVGQPSTRSS
jgi:hypothetical protein